MKTAENGGRLLLGRAASMVYRSSPGLTLASLFLTILQGLLPLVPLYLLKLLIDGLERALAGEAAGFGTAAVLIVGMGLVALLSATIKSVSAVVEQAQSMMVTDGVQDDLHRRSIAVDLSYYEDHRFYDTLHRAQQEAPYRPTAIVRDLVMTVRNGVSLLAMLGMLLSFHWSVSLVLAVAALPGVLVKLRFSKIRWRWHRKRTETERRAWYKHWLLTSAEHAKELRLFGLGEHFRERYTNLRNTLREESLAISRRMAWADLMTEVLSTVLVYGSLAFIAWRTYLGLITIGSMVMYFQAFRQGLGYLRGLLGNMADLYEGNLFLRNLFEFLDIRAEVKDPSDPVPFPAPITRGLELDGVSFSYPATGRRVLEDVSLTVGQGEMVALVGENGSGKTTLVKLICRLYDPDSGSIMIDGVPLRLFSVEELRKNISVLFQDYARYHLPASENISLGDIGRGQDIDAIIRAAETAGVHTLISGLPLGYETVLGRRFSGGQEISTGEWQRIALARAFFRNAGLVILDEPTSALDARAEEDLFSAFRSLASGRTSLVISHRFSTVRMADRIAVLDGGGIVESGSHDELMARGGLYSRMYSIQARAYL